MGTLPQVQWRMALKGCLLVICALISGCATYRPACVPVTGRGIGSGDDYDKVLEGDTVRMVLQSGHKVSGKVRWVSGEKLALGRPGSQGDDDLVIDLADIARAEIRDQSDGRIEGYWFLALGVGAAYSVYVTLHNWPE